MAPTTYFSHKTRRTTGALTATGLLVGSIALVHGLEPAEHEPSAFPQASTTIPSTSLASAHTNLTFVPVALKRPETDPQAAAQREAQRAELRRAAEDKAAWLEQQRRAETEQAAEDAAQPDGQAQAEEAAQVEETLATPTDTAEDVVLDRLHSSEESSADDSQLPEGGGTGGPQTQGIVPAAEIVGDGAPRPASPHTALGDAVAEAAKSQVGVRQDCTMLVTNALRARGISFHGWPKDYLSLGHTVSAEEARPGDIVYYASNGMGGSHVAIYLGNGRAVHGGWEGGTTAEFGTELPNASSPLYIRVDR